MPANITAERLKTQKHNYLKAHRVAVATEWVKESVVNDYGINADKVAVVGLGSEKTVRVSPDNKDWSKPVFLFVGKDWERKNGSLVVETFTKIREQHPDAELHLVGGHPSLNLPGIIEHGLLDSASEKDQKKLQELYAQATCLVVPSVFEPAGLVYVEAGRSGVPSIGTKNGGAPFMIGDGGIAVDPASPAELQKAMEELADSSTGRELAEKAFAHSDWFTWKKVAERIVDLF